MKEVDWTFGREDRPRKATIRGALATALLGLAVLLGLALIVLVAWSLGASAKADGQDEQHSCVPGVASFVIREQDAEKWDNARADLAQHGIECFQAAKNVWTCVRKCD